MHFGALCRDGLTLRLDAGRVADSSEGLAGLVAMMRSGEGPSTEFGAPPLCLECQKRSQTLLDDLFGAAESHQAFGRDPEVSVLFFGDADAIAHTWAELARTMQADEPSLTG